MTVGRAPGLAPGHSICLPVCMCQNVCVCVCVHVTTARLDPLTLRHSGSVPNGTNRHATDTHIRAAHPRVWHKQESELDFKEALLIHNRSPSEEKSRESYH